MKARLSNLEARSQSLAAWFAFCGRPAFRLEESFLLFLAEEFLCISIAIEVSVAELLLWRCFMTADVLTGAPFDLLLFVLITWIRLLATLIPVPLFEPSVVVEQLF